MLVIGTTMCVSEERGGGGVRATVDVMIPISNENIMKDLISPRNVDVAQAHISIPFMGGLFPCMSLLVH
jgi:hypothetical protein